MKEKNLSRLMSLSFFLGILIIVLGIILTVLYSELFLIVTVLGITTMLGLPMLLSVKIKVNVLDDLKTMKRNKMQEFLFNYLSGKYGRFLSEDKYLCDAEIMTNYANFGFMRKDKKKHPLYVELKKKCFNVIYQKQKATGYYRDYADSDELFKVIKAICIDYMVGKKR